VTCHLWRTAIVNPIRGLLISLPVCAIAAAGQTALDSAPVTEVGPRKILVGDLRDELTARRTQDLARNKLDAFTAAGRDDALRELIDRKLFAAAARDEGLDRQPDVARRLENVIDQFLAQTEVNTIAAKQPTDDGALRAYYNGHADEFRPPSQVRARHIVVKTRAEAETILEQLHAGADFAALAREQNVDSTKATGGDLGLVRRGTMVAPFDQALFATKPGSLSTIVQTSFGFHIIKVEGIEEGELPSFEAIKDTVKQKMLERRVADARRELERKYPVRIDKDALATLDR